MDFTFPSSGLLWAARWCQCGTGEGAVQRPADAGSVPEVRGGELPEAAETHRRSRPEPSPFSLPQLRQEDLQEEQVREKDGHRGVGCECLIPLWTSVAIFVLKRVGQG